MTIQTTTLPNGFRIIYEHPKTKNPLTSFQVFCDVGSIHEPDHIRGACHFIEHMCFKGTKAVPKSKDIYYVYDNVGAYFNASTTKRYTNYMVKCQDLYVKNCLGILSDMMLHSIFQKSEFEKEEQVVIEENIKNADEPEDTLEEMTDRLLYSNTPFQYSVDTLAYHHRRFPYSDILAFYREHYQPSHMILSIVTNLPFSTIVKWVKQTAFGKDRDLPTVSARPMPFPPIEPVTTIQYNCKEKPELKSIHLTIAFQTCNQYSADKYILNFLRNVLSGSLSSRLFTILRDKNGLTYRSSISTSYFEVGGEFTIYTQMDSSKLIKNGTKGAGVLPLIVQILNDIIKHGITAEELSMFQSNLRGKMILDQEYLDTQVEYNGTESLYKEPADIIPYSELYDTYYQSIDLKKIHDCIRTYFKKERMVVCMIGGKLPSLKSIQAICDTIV